MKVVLLADAGSIHTFRWANGLSKQGIEVHLISQHRPKQQYTDGVKVHILKGQGLLGYFLIVPKVRRLLKEIQPNLINAHYASGYGTTARLTNYRPLLLSVWGSDVYDFPYKSFLHNYLIKKNLLASDAIASTSHCMAAQTNKLVKLNKEIYITPFGVDIEYFSVATGVKQSAGEIIIGTVKTMDDKYGIDTLIESFSILLTNIKITAPELAEKLKLRLVGGGPKTAQLKLLAKQKAVFDRVEFVGQVDHTQVAHELAAFDIYVALSRLDSESFGVAIIEAGAASKPVVVSDAGGLPEVVKNEVTGLVVTKEDPVAAAKAIEKLVTNAELREKMGAAAKQHVEQTYCWSICLKQMKNVYNQVIEDFKVAKND